MDRLDHIKEKINQSDLSKKDKIQIIHEEINANSKDFLLALVKRKIISSPETAVEDLHENNYCACAEDNNCTLILAETVVWLRAKNKEDAENLRFDMNFQQGPAMA